MFMCRLAQSRPTPSNKIGTKEYDNIPCWSNAAASANEEVRETDRNFRHFSLLLELKFEHCTIALTIRASSPSIHCDSPMQVSACGAHTIMNNDS